MRTTRSSYSLKQTLFTCCVTTLKSVLLACLPLLSERLLILTSTSEFSERLFVSLFTFLAICFQKDYLLAYLFLAPGF